MGVLRRERGISILEILFATAILFFVLTAMLTTMGVATQMSTKARYTSIATSLTEQEMERCRLVPYSQLGLTSASSDEPSGTLLANETTTVANVAFTITRNIVWVDDPADGTGASDGNPHDYKRVTISVSWTSSVSSGTLALSSNFREADKQGIQPSVRFTEAPESGAIIYQPGAPSTPSGGVAAVKHSDGAVARWQAEADDTADPDGGIASLTFYFDGVPMHRLGYAPPLDVCAFAPGPDDDRKLFTAPYPPFTIDTLATDASGTAYYSEGQHEVKVETWDDSGLRDFRVHQLVIDNYPPQTPEVIAAQATPSDDGRYSSMDIQWSAALDGNTTAGRYMLYRNPYNGYGGTYYLTADVGGTSVTTSTLYNDDIAVGAPAYPLGSVRVWDFYVQALSPAGWTSGATYTAQRAVNGPGLAGTVYEPAANKRDVKVIWGDRTWTVASTVVYDVAFSRNAPGGSPPNMFTDPGAATTVISGVATSTGSGSYAPVPVGFTTEPTSSATWRTTWVTSTPASPHWQWESTVLWRKQDPNPYSYMQVRARLIGGYRTGTVYSNVIGPKGSAVGAYADNPYVFY